MVRNKIWDDKKLLKTVKQQHHRQLNIQNVLNHKRINNKKERMYIYILNVIVKKINYFFRFPPTVI